MLIPFAVLLCAAICAANSCTVNQPARHTNTNELVWDRSFHDAVSCFVGDRRADYLYSGGTVADQILDVLGEGRPTLRRELVNVCASQPAGGARVLRKARP